MKYLFLSLFLFIGVSSFAQKMVLWRIEHLKDSSRVVVDRTMQYADGRYYHLYDTISKKNDRKILDTLLKIPDSTVRRTLKQYHHLGGGWSMDLEWEKDSLSAPPDWGAKFDTFNIGVYKFIHKSVPSEIDSSKWILFEIKDGVYRYVKLYSFGIYEGIYYDESQKVPDSILKKIDPFLLMAGEKASFTYLVGNMTRRYLWTDHLVDGATEKDTIAQPLGRVIPDDNNHTTIYQTQWMVGGIFGECVKITTDSVVAYPKDRKYIGGGWSMDVLDTNIDYSNEPDDDPKKVFPVEHIYSTLGYAMGPVNDTVKVLLSTYKSTSAAFPAMHIPADTLWHHVRERGWVIVSAGTVIKQGAPVLEETAGYLLRDKRPMYEHVARAVYYNW